MWWKAHSNIMYGDDHPFFQSGKWERFTPQVKGFYIHSGGCSADHTCTALRKIAKELGFTEKDREQFLGH